MEQENWSSEPEAAAPTGRFRKKKKEKLSPVQNMLLYLHDLVYLMAGVLLVLLVCFRIVVVSGPSMYDTLVNGDYLLLLSHVFYSQPKQGDIIVASKADYKEGELIVKRVIATEGQTVRIDYEEGVVYVDEVPLDEPYTYTDTNLFEGIENPIVVEKGCVFVMGDNRNVSKDSRNPEIGLIDTRQIVGKVIFLFVPGQDVESGNTRDYGRIGLVS